VPSGDGNSTSAKSRRVQGEEECLHRRDGRVASGGASVARGLDLKANPHEGRLSAQPKSRCGTYGRPYVCRMLIHRARCTPCSLNPARRGSSAMRWRQVPAPSCRTEIAYAHASAHERQARYVGKLLSRSLIRDTSVVRPIHGLTSALREVSATHFPNKLRAICRTRIASCRSLTKPERPPYRQSYTEELSSVMPGRVSPVLGAHPSALRASGPALCAVLSVRTNFSNVLPIPQPKTKSPP
jgi:hypothetical protein